MINKGFLHDYVNHSRIRGRNGEDVEETEYHETDEDASDNPIDEVEAVENRIADEEKSGL